jgi:anti-anti-sigma regulatory factor
VSDPPGATHLFTVTTATAGGACVGEAHVVTVSGVPSGETWAELDHALRTVYERGGQKVALDFSRLDAVDPAFFEVLHRHVVQFRARGGDIVLACPDEPVPTAELRAERRIEDAVASLLA